MLSSLSNVFGRPFIIGFALPTIIFFIACSTTLPYSFFRDEAGSFLLEPNTAEVAYIVLCVWLAAIFLSILNTPIYRFLLGYYWPLRDSKQLREEQKKAFMSLSSEYQKLATKSEDNQDQSSNADSDKDKDYRAAQKLLSLLRTHFPYEETSLMPTRLGNAVRSFERYPNSVYGGDGVALWGRLLGVAPEKSIEVVNDEKSKCDFFVNLCFFASLYFLLSSLIAVFHLAAINNDDCVLSHCKLFHAHNTGLGVLGATVAVISTRLFYNASVYMAVQWGNAVRALFDVSINELLEVMGVADLPDANSKRNALTKISMQAVYAEPANLEKLTREASGEEEPISHHDVYDVCSSPREEPEPLRELNRFQCLLTLIGYGKPRR